MLTISSYQSQACFNAWMKCENLLVSIMGVKSSMSKKLTKVVDECALICMGTFHAIKTYSPNINNFALLCVACRRFNTYPDCYRNYSAVIGNYPKSMI